MKKYRHRENGYIVEAEWVYEVGSYYVKLYQGGLAYSVFGVDEEMGKQNVDGYLATNDFKKLFEPVEDIVKACRNKYAEAVSLAIRTINDIRRLMVWPPTATNQKIVEQELKALVKAVLLPVMPKEAPKEKG